MVPQGIEDWHRCSTRARAHTKETLPSSLRMAGRRTTATALTLFFLTCIVVGQSPDDFLMMYPAIVRIQASTPALP